MTSRDLDPPRPVESFGFAFCAVDAVDPRTVYISAPILTSCSQIWKSTDGWARPCRPSVRTFRRAPPPGEPSSRVGNSLRV